MVVLMAEFVVINGDVPDSATTRIELCSKLNALVDITIVLFVVLLAWVVSDLFAKCKQCCTDPPKQQDRAAVARAELIPRGEERSDDTCN